jgi:allantoinase
MKKDSKRLRLIRARICAGGNEMAECSVTVCDGKIEAVDRSAVLGTVDIDLAGLWLLPGAIDGHVHFDEPGFTHRENFASGTLAASAGGVTTVIDMPCTSAPPVTDLASYDRKLKVVAPKARVDFALWAGVRGNGYSTEHVRRSLQSLYSYGVRSIKAYLISAMPSFEDLSAEQLEEVLVAARECGLMVGVHAEDKRMVLEGAARESSAPDASGPMAYVRARSAEAEAQGIETCIRLAEKTGARLHIVHLACGEGVRKIREARARGVSITAETCPHYLAFTSEDLVRLGSVLKTAPVVKSAQDRDALWEGIADGTIDTIGTDHAPGQWPSEKNTGSIWTDYGGLPGVELLLPFLLSEGVHKGRITLERAIELVCSGPARIHCLESSKGSLQPGLDADLVVVDPEIAWPVHANELYTAQKYTPFEGFTFTGRVLRTFVRGTEVFDRSVGAVGRACGQLVSPDHDSAA